MTRRLSKVAAIVISLAAIPATALAQAQVPVFPADSRPYGATYGEWSAAWWSYVMRLPPEGHPLADPTGERCAVEQDGSVFFLMGTVGGPGVRRKCTVPVGKAILFPLVNVLCAVPDDGATEADIRAICSFIADLVDTASLAATVDGIPLQGLEGFRFQSPTFSFEGATPNLFSPLYEGPRDIAFADGYWVMLPPLSAGAHTIHFHAEVPAFEFVVDVAYELAVSPR